MALGGQRLRDAETEEMIESMQTKLVELEQENGMLKNKVLILKTQQKFYNLVTCCKFPPLQITKSFLYRCEMTCGVHWNALIVACLGSVLTQRLYVC